MLSKSLDKVWCLVRESWLEFLDINPFQLGAALAYYAVFSLPPMIIIIVNAAGLFYGRKAVEGQIYVYMKDYIGVEGALEVQKMVANLSQYSGLTLATIIGIAALLIAATGAFISLQDSLNFIWGVKPKPKQAFMKLVRDRFMSFLMILGITSLLLALVLVQSAFSWLNNHLILNIEGSQVFIANAVNLILSTLVIAFLFAAVYKFLPDADIKWRDVRVGAGVTAGLFTIGKILIATYIGKTDVASVYGAAGIMAILLVWVFYSSQILFFGAVFTLVYSRKYGSNIYPKQYAVRVAYKEVEMGHRAVNKDKGKYEEKENVPKDEDEALRE
ncbi:YihY/virulence factor BrkB family protein [Adhaeribacter soli]|uniref:YihY/virulence factor BrkB family protein n=1 Tax=Adhaeribacter soli TaxID=2607655 RepID=A0A5N1ITN6_9BACT|nr:YihY/virulence factor BrkB family protein [Adhaeribacter soli]KAA9331726.1 YihY/virulence factor BrkB family protein [Adhaeribacter soli]